MLQKIDLLRYFSCHFSFTTDRDHVWMRLKEIKTFKKRYLNEINVEADHKKYILVQLNGLWPAGPNLDPFEQSKIKRTIKNLPIPGEI